MTTDNKGAMTDVDILWIASKYGDEKGLMSGADLIAFARAVLASRPAQAVGADILSDLRQLASEASDHTPNSFRGNVLALANRSRALGVIAPVPAEGAKTITPFQQSAIDYVKRKQTFPANEADALLAAILRYTGEFYGAAIEHGMPSAGTANAVAHMERAARRLHSLATAPEPIPVPAESLLTPFNPLNAASNVNRPAPAAPDPIHASDCALHNGPAIIPKNCSCGVEPGKTPAQHGSEEPIHASDASNLHGEVRKNDSRVIDGRLWICTDPEIDRWVTSGADAVPVHAATVVLADDDSKWIEARIEISNVPIGAKLYYLPAAAKGEA